MSNGQQFSVVLPVRNGGEHVKLCVASVLAQTLADRFELLVLDNCSTDGTAEWLNSLRDPRVRVYPADRPLSIEANWSRIKEIAKREFVTMIGHDDLLDPSFLEVVSRLIQAHPDASLYLTHFRLIDAQGTLVRRCLPMPAREPAAEFLAARLCRLRDSYGTGYVLRSREYDALGGIPVYPKLLYADDALFLRAMAPSYRATALEEAFSYRTHAISASGACAAGEMFRGLEHYAELLHEQQRTDAALRLVLQRSFVDYAAVVGMAWLTEERLLAYRARRPLSPEVQKRVRTLTTLFGGTFDPQATGELKDRLLARADRSILHYGLYRFLAWQPKARNMVRRLLTKSL